MEEAKASWNTIYQSKEGFECQITLRDEDGMFTINPKFAVSVIAQSHPDSFALRMLALEEGHGFTEIVKG